MASGIDDLMINIEHDIDEQYQYTPGEIIRGQILLVARRPVNLASITIQIKGEGVVAWEQQDTHVSYNTNEVYVNASTLLPETQDVKLHAGRHSFDFVYELPDNLPSSYIGKYGSVTYVLKATAFGDRRTDTTITSEPFLVLRHTVLPDHSNRRVSVDAEKKVYGSCWCGKVKARAAVHRIGILPGEDLFVDAEIKNKSPRVVSAVQAALVMDTRYHAQNVVNHFRQIINRRRDEMELLKNEGRRWQNVRLSIPPYIPESRLEFCDIIDIEYLFQLRVEIAGGKDIVLDVPIEIASRHNTKDMSEKVSGYNLHNSNSTWTDLTLRKMRHETRNEDFYVPNGDARSLDTPKWQGFTLPEMRMDTNIENPLFDKEPAICDETPKVEVIESTKL